MQNKALDLSAVLKNLSEASRHWLTWNILSTTRQRRRARECSKRGISLAGTPNMVATPSQGTVKVVEGVLSRNKNAQYAISGQEFAFDNRTTIYGEFRSGAFCTVSLAVQEGEKAYATKVVARGL